MSIKIHERPLFIRLAIGILFFIMLLARAARAAPVLQATPRSTPTIKVCHICGDDIVGGSAAPELASTGANAQVTSVVHVVMFWMNGCPHCHDLLDKVLPPLQEEYGPQLEILLIEVVTMDDMNHLYEVSEFYGIPREQVGVPFLLIGEHVLIGSDQIPAELPGLIEAYIAQGGVPLPDIPISYETTPTPVDLLTSGPPRATAIVNGILFTTPDCHDCQLIASQALKLAREDYNGQFSIEAIDIVTSADVDYLYQVTAGYGLVKDDVNLPLLILGDQVLIGEEIPARLPALIETYFEAGGVAPPMLPTPYNQGKPLPAAPAPAHPDGFWLAIAVMIFMASALVYTLIRIALASFRDRLPRSIPAWQSWAIPLLALIGLGVAGYLAYVETQMVSAACGPIGDCNAVQSSPYARLFGVLPIGVLGMAGYLAILAIWGWSRFRQDVLARYAPLGLYGMTFLGTLFSLYLTYLEPFVIEAVCIWCITSAIIITLLLLLSISPAIHVLTQDVDD